MSINYNRMNGGQIAMTVISIIVFFMSLMYLRNRGSGFMTPVITFVSILIPFMQLLGWSWWFISWLFLAVMLVMVPILSYFRTLTSLNKFMPISSLLALALIITAAVPTIKSTLAPNMTGTWPVFSYILSGIILLIAIGVGLGGGNWFLGMMSIGTTIASIGRFIWRNKAKSFVTLLGLVYAAIYFSYSVPQMIQWVTGAAPSSNLTLWILNLITIGLAIILGVAFYAATLSSFPPELGFLSRLGRLFAGPIALRIFKILGAIALIGGLVYALIQLGFIQFPAVGNIVTLIIQILCVLAVLFGVFRYVIGNPRLLASIKNNIFIRLLFTIIMVIPCLLVYLTEGVVSTGKVATAAVGKGASFAAKVRAVSPPKMVFIVLAAEILLVSSYIFLPMFRKWIYTFTLGSSGDLVLEQRIDGVQDAIIAAQKKYIDDTSIGTTQLSNVNWEKIYSEKLYLTDDEHTKALTVYLTSLGYKTNYSAVRDNKIVSDILGKPITIEAAQSFIQTTNTVESIIDASLTIDHLKNKLDALEKQPEQGGPFKSRILNNKPTYINKRTNLGLFENLKGQSTSKFNNGKIATQSSDAADDYNYNYGLSAWIFLMAQGPNYGVGYSKFTKVLDYASKPTIWYNPEINTLKITVRVYKKGNDKTLYDKVIYKTTDIPLQRWNNIVINYVGGTLDIFINKKLVASIPNVIPYMSPDAITIGDNPGISGAVANVTYFATPISKNRISFFYDNLVNKDPPII